MDAMPPPPEPLPDDEPPPIYITCFLMVCWNDPVALTCGNSDAYVPFFAYCDLVTSRSATLTDIFSERAILRASSSVSTSVLSAFAGASS